MDSVIVNIEARIALITLNRPEKLNALNYEMIDRLLERFNGLETDENVGVVIMTGEGRAFSAGGDIREFAGSVAAGKDVALRDFVRRGQSLTSRIEAYSKPVIVAVNGLAYGGGCEITEAAHLAIASDRARFAKPEIKLGMPPTFGGTQRLPRLVGRKRALHLLLTGDPFDPDDAQRIGLVNAVVSHDELIDAARALARRILRHSTVATGAILSAVTRGLNMSIAEGLLVESEQFCPIGGKPRSQRRPLGLAGASDAGVLGLLSIELECR